MRLKNIWHILLILLMFTQYIHAQENRTEVKIDFRVNVTRIDPKYSDNAARIREIVSYLKNIENDPRVDIVSVSFCGAASPEGHYEWNRSLAKGRLSSLESVVRKEAAIPDSIIVRDDGYIPWEYLRERVSESNMRYKNDVLSIIDEEPRLVGYHLPDRLVDHRIVKLKRLDDQRVWNELFRKYFGRMRSASAVIVTRKNESRTAPPVLSDAPELPSIRPSVVPSGIPEYSGLPHIRIRKPFYMGIYTNMVYDVLAVPNLGAEFYLDRNWSIAGSWMHSWWSNDPRHTYWRIYGGEINVRYWFGKASRIKPLTGHHIGVYAHALTYDFELGGKAYMGGEPRGTILDRAHFGGGFEYGYSLPVARRFNIDFTVGIGYIGGRVYEFVPDKDRYLWTNTRDSHWFGPTKLAVSLVWLIGRGNVNANKGKGGAR